MVEKKKANIIDTFDDDQNLDPIYLHHKNRHFKHNPYVGYTIKKIDKKKNGNQLVKTNTLGLRCNELHTIEEANSILLGGSVAFSSFASSEEDTISSLLEKNVGKKILNCGVGGHILKQHLSLYFNYIKNIETKNIIILFGFNDMANCYSGRKYNDIINQEFSTKIQENYLSPINSSLKNIFHEIFRLLKLEKVIFNFLSKKNQIKINNTDKDENIEQYIGEIIKDINFFRKYCIKFNINLIISLQPCIYLINKKLTDYENKRLNNYISEYPERNEFVNKFYNLLDKNLNSFENYHNLNNAYKETNETVLIDEMHLTDIGNKYLANYYKKFIIN